VVEGRYDAISRNGPFGGRIVCFTIIGNEAWVGVEIEYWTVEPPGGLERWFYVQDNGEGRKADPDLSTASPRVSPAWEGLQEFCEYPGPGNASVDEVQAGNVRIEP
jgi:hypothetical protein